MRCGYNLNVFFMLQRGAVIRYSPNSSVVPYFSEILPLYHIDAHFPKNSQSPVPYRHPHGVPYNAPLYYLPSNKLKDFKKGIPRRDLQE